MSFGLESKLKISCSNHCVFVRCGVGEQMIPAFVFPTIKHGGGGVMVWWCFAGDNFRDLFRIQGILNQHGYHSILKQYSLTHTTTQSYTWNKQTYNQ